MRLTTIILALALSVPTAVQALTLDFPGMADRAMRDVTPMSSFALPVGPWQDGHLETLPAEGEVRREAWHVEGDGLTTLQILKPLREQLAEDGFEILFECESDGCGGFDFRYAQNILPEPAMHVDLGDFRVLTARKLGLEATHHICLLVSRSSARGYVQLVHIGPPDDTPEPVVVTSTKTPDATAADMPDDRVTPLGAQLETLGRAVLHDVAFDTGSSRLGDGPYDTLTALADYLKAHPTRRVVLVGHTDAVGSLAGNIALSRERAQAVADHLVTALNVPTAQIDANGVGYLAPAASNLTDDGREQNRRVEAILTSTE